MKERINIESLFLEIRKGRVERDRMISLLYYDDILRNKIRGMLYKKGGVSDDFDMIFNSTIMQFTKTIIKNKDFQLTSSLDSYIVGIAKHIWYNEVRKIKNNRFENIEKTSEFSHNSTPESLLIDFNKKELIKKLLLNVGNKCREILMYWANGYRMKEIAGLMGYKSEGMAKKKKYVCLKELVVFLDKNPNIKTVLR